MSQFPLLPPANIGFHRTEDNKWIQQYTALFCVLNSEGQVMTWKFTESVKFNQCEDILVALRQRLESQNRSVSEFVVDICCSWRKKLQSVFGPNLTVLLDLFHAVQRVLEKIPKRHKLRQMCAGDFQMVFRNPADKGEERTMATPSAGSYS